MCDVAAASHAHDAAFSSRGVVMKKKYEYSKGPKARENFEKLTGAAIYYGESIPPKAMCAKHAVPP